MLIPGHAYLEFRDAFRRGDGDTVLGTGQPVLDDLGADDRQAGLVPAVLLMVGATLARLERYADACAYLERGLLILPGTDATREVGDGDWYTLVHLDLLLVTGRFRDAWIRIQALVEPDRPTSTRLGATRAQVALYATFGDFETAQQLLNTAAGLADRVGSRQLAAMVDGDRAIVLAEQGRTVEAAVFADQVLPQLGRTGPGPLLRWSGAAASTVTTTVARHAAVHGDLMTAERMLFLATDPTESSGRTFDSAQLQLARGVVWREVATNRRRRSCAARGPPGLPVAGLHAGGGAGPTRGGPTRDGEGHVGLGPAALRTGTRRVRPARPHPRGRSHR